MSGSKKASAASPSRSIGHSAIDFVLHKRLQRCWEEDINWNKIPTKIKKSKGYICKDLFNVNEL